MLTPRRTLPALLAAMLATASQAADLSIDITQTADEPYENAVALVKQAGATATSLSLFWDELEPVPGQYSADPDWPAIANAYYPSEGMRLTLTFSVIDTVADRRPEALQDLAWDDPQVIAAFASHLNIVLARLKDTEILTLSIGNEVDGLLSSPAEIAAFARFVSHARETIRRHRPGIPVGTKLTFAGALRDPALWQPLFETSTALQITYYPLAADFGIAHDLDVARDLDTMAALAPGLPLHVLEAGYPSEGCRGTPTGQRAFVQDLLASADAMPRVKLVSLTWLTDIPTAQVDGYAAYYGVNAPCFARYLASLGLRDQTGRAKPALDWLLSR